MGCGMGWRARDRESGIVGEMGEGDRGVRKSEREESAGSEWLAMADPHPTISDTRDRIGFSPQADGPDILRIPYPLQWRSLACREGFHGPHPHPHPPLRSLFCERAGL